MLSAELYALESKSVQAIVNIRQRELDYMNLRNNAMGTQASLLAGFVIGSFASNSVLGLTSNAALQLLYYSTAVSLFALLHVTLVTTFLAIWGPGLALRGKTGSVSKAYTAMSDEMPWMNMWFVVGVVTFWLQCVAIFYGYSGTPTNGENYLIFAIEADFATVIMIIGSIVSGYLILEMKASMATREIDGKIEIDVASLPEEVEHNRNVHEGMDRNRVGNVKNMADWSKDLVPDVMESGKKQLKQMYGRASMTSWMRKKSSKFVGFDKWDRRFFVLQGVTLRYYQTEEDAQAHSTFLAEQRRAKAAKRKELGDAMSTLGGTLGDTLSTWGRTLGGSKNSTAPEVPYDGDAGTLVDLKGYEVMLNPSDPNFGFQIQPITRKERKSRTWFLRPADAAERDAWVEVLLAATIYANGSSASSQ